jgi:hypothetical protein
MSNVVINSFPRPASRRGERKVRARLRDVMISEFGVCSNITQIKLEMGQNNTGCTSQEVEKQQSAALLETHEIFTMLRVTKYVREKVDTDV